MSLLYPWFLLTPLIVGLLYLARIAKPSKITVAYPSVAALRDLPTTVRARLRTPLLLLLSAAVLCALAVSVARPQSVITIPNQTLSRNLVLTLDLSRSMRTRDFQTTLGPVDRLSAVATVVTEFINSRINDRIGLVVFGSHAFLQSPLTLDHELLQTLVSELGNIDAGPATAMGDGLGLAVKRVTSQPANSRAIILLTDGVSNAGHVSPLKAARVASELGIPVYTIGIGPEGQTDQGEFDEATLQKIATITKGHYFRASSLQGLQEVYRQIDQLETSKNQDPVRRLAEEHYGRWALIAALLYLTLLVSFHTIFLKVP